MAKNTALDVPLFYGNCGTSSQCVPINTPGAESTNNVTRVRRLGPRWQGQRESSTQRGRPGVLFEIPRPSKSVTETPSLPHQLAGRDDAALIDGAPIAGLVVTMPLRTAASRDSSQGDLPDSTAALDINRRSTLRLYISLALAALMVLIVLTGIAWQERAKHTDSSAVAIANRPSAAGNSSPVISPLNGEHAQSTVAMGEAPRHQDRVDASADRAPQTRVNEEENHVRVLNRKKVTGADSTRSADRPKAKTKNNADASVDLANAYLRSEGVPRGCEKALPLLKTAASTGSVRACNRLASMYAIGSCVPRDPLHAYRWVSVALDADPRNHWAQQNRDLIVHQMTAEERSQIRSTE